MTSTAETIRTVIAEMREFYERAVTIDDDQFLSWIDRLEPLVRTAPDNAAPLVPASHRKLSPAPERIWLQIDTNGEPTDPMPPQWDELADVSWCGHSIGGLEVEYVRADLALIDGQGKPSSSISPKEQFERWYGSCDARFWNPWDACYSAFLAGRRSMQPAAPGGEAVGDWVLVPRVPTQAMLEAFNDWRPTEGNHHAGAQSVSAQARWEFRQRYAALLAAAPQQPTKGEGVGRE